MQSKPKIKFPSVSQICRGRRGLASASKDDFIDLYKWQLEEYGKSTHKFMIGLPLKTYYDIGLYCIDNKISMMNFIATATDEYFKALLESERLSKNNKKEQQEVKMKGLFDV